MSCADLSLGTERRRRDRDLPLVGVRARRKRCHSCRVGKGAPFVEKSSIGHREASERVRCRPRSRSRWMRSAPGIRVHGSIPSRARMGPATHKSRRAGLGVSKELSLPPHTRRCDHTHSRKKERTLTQQVIAHGTPASATTVVAPFKPLSQNVNAIQAAYHPNPTVQKFRGVIFWRRYRPGRPTRAGRARRHCCHRCHR